MRVVFDTNVLLSGLLWHGPPYECIVAAEGGLFQLILSEPILDEVGDKRRAKFREDEQATAEFLTYLREIAQIVSIQGQMGWVKADPDDDKIIETAVAGTAEFVVSGDHHLLDLTNIAGVSVLTAREFALRLRTRSQD